MRSIHMAGGVLTSNFGKAHKIFHTGDVIQYDVIDHLLHQPYV